MLDKIYSTINIFNLIEFFGLAALFGWFTFATFGDEQIKGISGKQQKDDAWNNLFTIGNYFILSFFFYSVSGIADYLYSHRSHPFSTLFIFIPNWLASTAVVSFLIATFLLVVPIGIFNYMRWRRRKLNAIYPASSLYILSLTVVSACNIIFAWSTVFCSSNLSISNFVWGGIPFVAVMIAPIFFWKVKTRVIFTRHKKTKRQFVKKKLTRTVKKIRWLFVIVAFVLAFAPALMYAVVIGFMNLYGGSTCPWFFS